MKEVISFCFFFEIFAGTAPGEAGAQPRLPVPSQGEKSNARMRACNLLRLVDFMKSTPSIFALSSSLGFPPFSSSLLRLDAKDALPVKEATKLFQPTTSLETSHTFRFRLKHKALPASCCGVAFALRASGILESDPSLARFLAEIGWVYENRAEVHLAFKLPDHSCCFRACREHQKARSGQCILSMAYCT